MGIDIRDATEADLPAILAIHNDAIATSTAIFSFHPVDLANRRAFAGRAAGAGLSVPGRGRSGRGAGLRLVRRLPAA